MAQKKSEFLSAFGKSFEIFKLIVNMVLELGGGDGELSSLLKEKDKIRRIGEIIMEKSFSVWKTIKLGTVSTAYDIRHELERIQCTIHNVADSILDNSSFTVSDKRSELRLVKLTPIELGFEGDDTTRVELYKRAIKRGLVLCPAEVGPQLLLQFPNSSLQNVCIAMEPISDTKGRLRVFVVTINKSEMTLDADDDSKVITVPGVAYSWIFALSDHNS